MTPREKLEAIGRILHAWKLPEPAEGWPEGDAMSSPAAVLRMIQDAIGDDHAAEVERLRAENERLSTELHHAKGEAERLRRYVGQFIEPVHAQREAAIYGAAFADAYQRGTELHAHEYALEVVAAWHLAQRLAAQKGGSDG